MAVDPNSNMGRTVQRIAGSRLFARVGPRIVPPVDRTVHRLSGGRIILSRAMLPCVILTTTGRRSGLARQSPLATVPLDGDLYVVGSNFGQPHHPAWSWNLMADPNATVSFDGETYAATAELLDAEDSARTWPLLIAEWPLFDQYVERSGRELRVFRLSRV